MPLTRREFLVVLRAIVSLAALYPTAPGTVVRAQEAGAGRPLASPNATFLAAVRDGDVVATRDLLARGADVNTRDVYGATALMQAALNADAAMVDLLLANGADVNASNDARTPALLWALHDPDKVKLLLDHGAAVPEQAVIIAAGLAGSRRTLPLLAEKGAKLDTDRDGNTPLWAALRIGDRDTVHYLLAKGANVKSRPPKGFTALTFASLRSGSDNSDLIGLLLEKGVSPEKGFEHNDPTPDIFTPLMLAASRGHAESVKRLLGAGADANVQEGTFGRTALIWAATTASSETVRELIVAGAFVDDEDFLGRTPLWWARRRGALDVVRLLKEAGAIEPASGPTPEPQRLREKIDAGSTKQAVALGLSLLQQSGKKFTAEAKDHCVSCHHQLLPAMAVGSARSRGFDVNEEIATEEISSVLKTLANIREKILLGEGVTDDLVPAYALVAMAAEGRRPDPLSDALVHFLTLRQKAEGCWQTPVYRPPHDASDFTFTALAVRGLRLYAPKGRAKEVEGRIARARDWLARGTAPETEDKAFRLLGLSWAGADRSLVQNATAALLRDQREEDGGWSQLPTLKSDAYATGQVLFALREGGGLADDDPAYLRGVEFLLKTQLVDGSWLVRTRSFPVQPQVETGFPHRRSQFISAAATGWATLALSLTVPPQEARER